jgi:hypothetical protein
LNKIIIKQEFSIKTPKELDKLTHKELFKYIKNLQKRLLKEKPKLIKSKPLQNLEAIS